jgi:hypothetical protein
MKGAITNYENTLFMDSVALSGVISFDGSYNIETKPINVIGKGFCKQVVAQVPSASVSITRYLVNNDPVFSLTGDRENYTASFTNGGLVYQGKNFGFTNGYLSSFGISCGVGDIPQIQSSFQIFGDVGPSINPSGNGVSSAVFVPQVKNISVTCNNSSTNRVKDFNIDFACKKEAIYGLSASNAQYPIEVQNIFPIEVGGSFTLEVDDYQTKNIFDILSSESLNSFSIDVRGTVLIDQFLVTADGLELVTSDTNEPFDVYRKLEDSVPIFNFSTNDAIIISEQINSTSDDLLSVKLSYKAYLNN